MLDILRTKLSCRPEGLVTILENIYFWKTLEKAYHHQVRPEDYAQERCYAHLRGVGHMLQEGGHHQLGFLVNLTNTHWIAIVVDFEHLQVLYGDSLSHLPSRHVIDVLTWWLGQHSTSPFTWKALDITHQSDEHSCGI